MNDRNSTSLNPTSRPMLLAALIALSALGSVACKSTEGEHSSTSATPGRVDLSNDLTVKATVVAVDPAARTITLLREDGSLFTVEAGPAVRNFEEIAKGDQLRVKYHESLSASQRPTSEGTSPVEAAAIAGRAAPGEKPAGGAGLAATVRVRVESVDRSNHLVVLSRASGELRTVRAQRPEGREFVDHLKVGDIVQLDYNVSLALAIEKL
jgi:hypothetical protein